MKRKINPYTFPGLDIEPKLVEIDDIVAAVEESTEINLQDLISDSRVWDIKDARHLLVYFLKKRTALTWIKISKIINKNHATAIHAFKRVDDIRDFDPYFKKHIPAVNYLINNRK